jgi:hypothetical protein
VVVVIVHKGCTVAQAAGVEWEMELPLLSLAGNALMSAVTSPFANERGKGVSAAVMVLPS